MSNIPLMITENPFHFLPKEIEDIIYSYKSDLETASIMDRSINQIRKIDYHVQRDIMDTSDVSPYRLITHTGPDTVIQHEVCALCNNFITTDNDFDHDKIIIHMCYCTTDDYTEYKRTQLIKHNYTYKDTVKNNFKKCMTELLMTDGEQICYYISRFW